MDGLSPELFRLIYGSTYFVMGLAVGVRAIAFPSSSFRNRLLALAAFGVLHALALWSAPLASNFEDSIPPFVRTLLYQPGNLALFYFAFGWDAKRPMLAHMIVFAAVCVFAAAVVVSPDMGFLQALTRLTIDFPSAACAAMVLLRDGAFRGGSRYVETMRRITAAGFALYAMLHFFPAPSEYFPASVLNGALFETVTGISTNSARAFSIVVVTIGMLSLLGHFDSVMREQSRTALAIADAKLRRALEITGLGIWEWNVADGSASWSGQMYRTLGYAPDSVAANSRQLFERVHPEDRDAVDAAVRATLETHKPYKLTHRIVTESGQVRVVEGRGEVEAGAGGKAVKMIGSLLDITEFEEARATLHERDAKLSKILQSSPEAIVVADATGKILLFNQGAREIFGYGAGETIGQHIEILLPERFRGTHRKELEAFGQSGESQRKIGEGGEITGLRRSGEEFPARATITKLETSDGLTYTIWLRDISRPRAIREELMAAKAAAEAANAAKSNFIANMSHELRTPLNAILGFSEVMEMQTFGPLGNDRYRGYVADIQKSGRHLLSIINDILNLSQLDAGKTKLKDMEIVELAELLEDCAKWVMPKAEEAGVELSYDPGDGLPALWGDRRLLRQIVLNLLSNAVKFTPKGGRVEIYAEGSAYGAVRICVRDTGIGMTADQIARIGEPFLQFDEARSRKFDGTGLGLSIAKRLAELHGGRLDVKSVPGEGTVFIVSMPAVRSVFGDPQNNLSAWG